MFNLPTFKEKKKRLVASFDFSTNYNTSFGSFYQTVLIKNLISVTTKKIPTQPAHIKAIVKRSSKIV